METKYQPLERESEFLKALANPVRLCILKKLLNKEECNGNELQRCLGFPQSTISQNINRLKNAGIIAGRREGNEIYYRLVDRTAKAILQILENSE